MNDADRKRYSDELMGKDEDFYRRAFDESARDRSIYSYPEICDGLSAFDEGRRAFLLSEAAFYYEKRLDEDEDSFTADLLEAAIKRWDVLSLEERFMPIDGTDFRLIDRHMIYVRDTEGQLRDAGILGDFAGYGFIDEEKGLSVYYVCTAAINGDHFIFGMPDAKKKLILNIGQLKGLDFQPMDKKYSEHGPLQSILFGIMKQYDARTIGINEIRGALDLDPLRHDEYPDDLRAVLICEGFNPEQVWVRSVKPTDDKIVARLLVEPYQDFGVHAGDVLELEPMDGGEAGLVLVAECENA